LWKCDIVIGGSSTQQTSASANAIGELDALRAILSAFSHRVGDSCAPVSIVSIQHELRRRNRDPELAARLNEIAEVRDVQNLGRGFWLPVPTHLVRLGGASLVVSGLPNQELTRRFAIKPLSFGVSRVLREEIKISETLPQSDLHEWIGAPGSTADWTQDCIANTKRHVPFGIDAADLYLSWINRSGRRWAPMCDNAPDRDGTYMGRVRATDGRFSYFMLRFHKRKATSLQEVPSDLDTILRLQFGLRSLHGNPNWFESPSGSPDRTLELPVLPSAEARLLKAVGLVRASASGYGLTVSFPEFATSSVFSCLAALGLALRQQLSW
jgi:hypothetical protein